MLPALRHHHARCTNGPCAGSINPIIPWSTLQGSSACKCAVLYLFPNFGSSGTAGKSTTSVTLPAPASGTYTHAYPSLSTTGNEFAKIFVGSKRSCEVNEGISSQRPLQGSKRHPWYLHCTVSPSNHPADSGIPRCGHKSLIANSFPSDFRPSSIGIPSKTAVSVPPGFSPSTLIAGYHSPKIISAGGPSFAPPSCTSPCPARIGFIL